MTVTTTNSIVAYTGDAVSTTFAVTFAFFKNTDLQVIQRVIATGAETVLALTTNYTVTGGAGTTGAVVMLVAPAATVTLTIRRLTARTQSTDLSSFGPFPAQSVEEMADRLTMIAQENERDGTRAVLVPITESSLMLPNSVTRANKYLQFDGAGNPTAATVVTVGALVISPFGESLVDDANSTVALGTLGISRVIWGGPTGGTADARTLTPSPAITAYSNGLTISFYSHLTNTAGVTMNVSGLGVVALGDRNRSNIVAGGLNSISQHTMVYYDGIFVLNGESNFPVYSGITVGDNNLTLAIAAGNPKLIYDAGNDYELFNRSTNRQELYIANVLAPRRVASGVLIDDTASMAQGWHTLESYTVAGAPAQKDFVLSTYITRGFKRFRLDWRNLSPAAAAVLMARFSTDAGSTYKAAGGDYGNSWWDWNASGSSFGGSGVGYVQLSAGNNVQTAASHASGSSGTMEFETDRAGVIIASHRSSYMRAGSLLAGLIGQSNTTFAGPINAVRIGFVAQNMENFGSVHLLGVAV